MLALISLIALAGCVNAYEEYYRPTNSGDVNAIQFTGEPRIVPSHGSPKQDILAMYEGGYTLIGTSKFVGSAADVDGAIQQAKKVGAAFIVIQSKYRNTETRAVPVVTPTTTTVHDSGTVNASGPGGSTFGTFKGTSTVQGTQTTFVPHSVDKYDQAAAYFAPMPRKGLGTWTDKPTAEQHQAMETNQGIAILAVRKESPAYKADLLPGDVILAVDGVPVPDNATFRPALAKDAGRDAEMTVFRKGHRITKKVHLAADTW
jgi:hypothetical protein